MTAKRRGLGRGLDALLETGESSSPTSVSVDHLRPNRLQPRTRFEGSALEELAASIRIQGVVQPILVTPRRDGAFTIIAGERRWRAAKKAGLAEVPVVVRDVASEREMFEMALVENLQRSDLNPIEEAEAYTRLLEEFGLTQEDVATRVGKGRSTVTNALRLLALPDEVQEFLREGTLSAGQVRPLLALASADEQVRWARRATQQKLTARQMEAAVSTKGSKSRRRRAQPDADTAAAEDKLTKALQTKVEIRRRGKGGTLKIAFHSEEELIRLYERLVQAGGRR
ncbi:MAG: ParB/RepB/Spo0J family partition protein [Gemmatimonadota bacterium]|nr:ParB/RepB/Spo0J family partition protein [Acidobacteriota bacterium]MDH3428036.1 ParB/RepB/Spo0J family partition protein [Gemmatimonadota bacterium]